MPLDSVTVSALAQELRGRIVGTKIDKVQQPERDTVILSLHGQGGSVKLALCGGVGNARVHITRSAYENPERPPMFCMLLRKHLCGARIAELVQPERERILILRLDGYDELGASVQKKLAVEMIGRGTNIILIDSEDRIIDCLRRVDSDMSALRQVLPGLIYRLPLQQSKPDPFRLTPQERQAVWEARDRALPPEKWLLQSYACLSPLLCRELVYRCGGDTDALPACLDALVDSVAAGEFTPYMLMEDGKPKDFSFLRIRQYGDAAQGETFPTFSALLDAFYTRRSQAEDMRRRTAALRKTVKNALERTERKLAAQNEELARTATREEKRRWGDLITANLYRAPKGGAESMTVEDFYADGAPEVTIPLDPLKTPQRNAAAYYKEYTKAKTAEQYLTRLIAENERARTYLSSVLDELERARGDADITDIRRELGETGYIKAKRGGKEKQRPTAPLRYRSSEGFEILVGRSNLQNDALTFHTARKGDLWLHVQKVHGSHVIVRCEGVQPDDSTLQQAASLAVLHSQAAAGGKVPVDYTRVKYVKKPAGALPGMVIYTDYATIVAEADEALAEKLKA